MKRNKESVKTVKHFESDEEPAEQIYHIILIGNVILKRQIGANMEMNVMLTNLKKSIGKICIFGKAHKNPLLLAGFALLVFLYGTYRLSEVGQPILFDDEYGYWSASSFFMGIDWSSLTSHIGYYSYGYGLLLVPIRFLGGLLMWNWSTLYQAAVVLNACMLAGSFLLSVKISSRFFETVSFFLRVLVCFTAAIYPSNIVFSHITWTENTLLFFFWVFLYLLMRCLDRPSVWNHAGLAFTSFYLYVVHQRALSILLTGIVMMLLLKLLKISRLRETAAFFGTFFLCTAVHSMIKGKLQNDFYLANSPADLKTTVGYAVSGKMLVLLLGILFLLFLFYLLDKGKTKWVILFLAAAAAAGAVCVFYLTGRGIGGDSAVPNRIANNDFAGQWEKIKGIFSRKGLIRLGVSMTGKWFYLAAGTGLVICWGLKDFIKNAFWMLVYGVKELGNAARGKTKEGGSGYLYDRKHIWLFGVSLAWLGTFMVCAIYKEGLYKVDDLVNGRYNEYVLGSLIVCSFYSLLADKKWVRTFVIGVVLYILAGVLCQYVFDELGRTDFELCHSVMFGRVFWNWEVPAGKVRQMSEYILPLGTAFILLVKLCSSRFPKVQTIRCVLGLLLPIIAWSYLTGSILENYVISRNEKQAVNMPAVSREITLLGWDKNVYFLKDTQNYRWAENIQFMLKDKAVIMTTSKEVTFEEDAFYIMNKSFLENESVQEKCVVVVESGQLALVAPKGQTLEERFNKFKLH